MRKKLSSINFELEWEIPKKDKEKGYCPIVRVGTHVPFGYAQHPEDPDVLLPVEKELELLKQAKDFISKKKYSYDAVAKWLSKKSGRSITKAGLFLRIKHDKSKRRQVGNYVRYARKAQEAAEKAKYLEESFFGRTYEEIAPGLEPYFSKCTCGALAPIRGFKGGSGEDNLPTEQGSSD